MPVCDQVHLPQAATWQLQFQPRAKASREGNPGHLIEWVVRFPCYGTKEADCFFPSAKVCNIATQVICQRAEGITPCSRYLPPRPIKTVEGRTGREPSNTHQLGLFL
ncbi:hypothetical protein V2G26_020912 [Clonostachys chloroleuca]